jgi:2,4-dienoyl-CoA reductase-like NADH-dependent reductase (Old Yellow Enzyme family)
MLRKFLLLSILCLAQLRSLEENKKDLFDQTQFKYLKLKNRVFKAAMVDCGSWENGKLGENLLKRYDELSKNEIGTIITGTILVDSPPGLEPMCRIDNDAYIEEYKKLTDMVHKNGANIIAQLHTLRELDIPVEEIHRVADLFADAAIRAKKAGFDGIEVCANHHVSLSQFLSPMFNHRTDEYGGSDENRARFVIEIIKKIREKIGDEYIILLKLNSEDDDPNGITPDGFITACKMAEQAGVDMIEVTGMKWKKNRENKLVYFDMGKTLADILKIPVLVTGGVKNLNVPNDALNNSNIQYIGICRAFLSEPDILVKWKNCEDKKSQCVSCMNCYKIDNSIEIECIINKRKKKKNLKKTN